MRTFQRLRNEPDDDLPPEFAESDVRFPERFVAHFLREHTDEGDVVLDPFAGFGTTLAVAERLDRTPYGVEFEADRAEYVEQRIDHPENVVHGSALELADFDLPPVDCCLTSPPYMVEGMDGNPFRNYAGEVTYEEYLDDVASAFAQVEGVLAADGTVLVEVSNLKDEGNVTTLAWDVADVVSETFHLDGEVVVGWQGEEGSEASDWGSYGYGYDHSYVLVFST